MLLSHLLNYSEVEFYTAFCEVEKSSFYHGIGCEISVRIKIKMLIEMAFVNIAITSHHVVKELKISLTRNVRKKQQIGVSITLRVFARCL
jgi:hypothetical protein